MVIGLALFFYTIIPSDSHFSQEPCVYAFEGNTKLVLELFYVLPFVVYILLPTETKWIVSIPFLLTALAWIVAIVLQRKRIWTKGQPFRFPGKFGTSSVCCEKV